MLGDFDPANYATEFVWATARDGSEGAGVARLPQGHAARRHGADAAVRLRRVRHTRPTRRFSIARLSLLDRGFVCAIAHVRGGQEIGRRWYDDGRLLNKKNTFTDFIDVTRYLVAERYADRKRGCSRWAAAPAAC